MYTTLNDASVTSSLLGSGEVKIWYLRPALASALLMGVQQAQSCGVIFSKAKLAETHIELGSINGRGSVNEIFGALQGDRWAPAGEAKQLIQSKGLQRLSMSTGDIIERDGVLFVIDHDGVVKLPA